MHTFSRHWVLNGVSMTDRLYAATSSRRYGAKDYGLLQSELEQLYTDTQVISLPPLGDLLINLSDPSQTLGGWRYSQQGLSSLLRYLSPGLQLVIDSVAGHAKHKRYSPNSYDLESASRLFNDILTLRYSDIIRRKIVICSSRRIIDGFVRNVNKHLDNHVFLSLVHDAASAQNFKFEAATLQHRKLCVWYREATKGVPVLAASDRSHTHWRGIYAGHNESPDGVWHIADPLHVSPAVLWTGGCTFGRRSGNGSSLYRSRKPITELLATTAANTISRLYSVESLTTSLARLSGIPLEIVDMKTDKSALAIWLSRCQAAGLPTTASRQLLQQAVQFGSGTEDTFVPGTTRTTVHRSLYDLYCVLSSGCRKWSQSHREAAENLAYSILFDIQ
jgi:hypothetical protein